MRRQVWGRLVGLVVIVTGLAAAQPQVDPEALQRLLQVYKGTTAVEPPTLVEAEGGFLKFIGAPPKGSFAIRDTAKATGNAGAGLQFVEEHRDVLGAVSDSVSFSSAGESSRPTGNYVRLQQQYGGLEVFGAQVVVQLQAGSGVRNVLSDILRDTTILDNGDLPLTPSISEAAAISSAKTLVAGLVAGMNPSQFSVGSSPRLLLFSPEVVGLEGPVRLVYHLSVVDSTGSIRYAVLVDAHSGEAVFRYSLTEQAISRVIYDAQGRSTPPTSPSRTEESEPAGIAEVDNAFDYLGDTYNFYLNEHDRDSYDDEGSAMVATVRLPFANAFWEGSSETMTFGTGWASDDIVAHELTHGVTQFTSSLIYFGFSGAINESLSDIWGEYVDLTNGRGTDSDSVRWFIGEDIEAEGPIDPEVKGEHPKLSHPKQEQVEVPEKAIRYMKDPTLFGDPDRLGSTFLASVTSFFDNGGVHINSGIGNKLAYLLTDGDTFNGFSISGMGISRAADLFYEAQLLLGPASDYEDLFLALGGATITLSYSFEDRINVSSAGRAVEIAPNTFVTEGLRNLRATPTRDLDGNAVISLTWTTPPADQYTSVTLVRSVLGFASSENQGNILFTGRSDRFLDTQIQEGVQYFYTIIADRLDSFPETDFARATAGTVAPSYFTQAFTGGVVTRPSIDLSFTQLLWSPVGPPATPIGSSNGVGSYGDYELTVKHGVSSLPVARQDAEGASFLLTLPDDGGVSYFFGDSVFPFFGQPYSNMYVASNGYISFVPIAFNSNYNFPSLAAHYAVPRISFLFSDLAPNTGGNIWARSFEDKVVVTYENIPEWIVVDFGVPATNTVQVELFYSGHIRVTYQQVATLEAVVGLSDGNGPPLDPASIFDNVQSVEEVTDLSAAPTVPQLLTFEPVGTQQVDAGELVEFSVAAVAPPGAGTPVLTATWDGPGTAPFADQGNGTGRFSYRTALDQQGVYTLRTVATLGDQRAFLDIRIVVGEVFPEPEAINLGIGTGTEGENIYANRTVQAETALSASYDYYHPLEESQPFYYEEGPSILYWMRNGLAMQSLINQLNVPSGLTRPGDNWQFRVVPITTTFIAGQEAVSPNVTIEGAPIITAVVPGFGPTAGGTPVTIRGSRLSSPLSVKFGGVAVQSIQVINDQELRVVTPVHAAGTVAVGVTTVNGTGTQRNAFIYTGDINALLKADVNNDGSVDAADVQLVINAVLQLPAAKALGTADANLDGAVNASDVQVVVNQALRR